MLLDYEGFWSLSEEVCEECSPVEVSQLELRNLADDIFWESPDSSLRQPESLQYSSSRFTGIVSTVNPF